jgi:ABC-type multidrug transport system ATPase subunit
MLEEMTETDPDLAVVLTTHAMDEADHLCDRVAIMDGGRFLCEDSPETLKRGLDTGERVEIETDRAIAAAERDAIVALGAVNWRSTFPRRRSSRRARAMASDAAPRSCSRSGATACGT